MKENLFALNQLIKGEADAILNEQGLRSVLNQYGSAHITGSYALDLMTWRDLDIYLETDSIHVTEFFILGSKIASILKPVKMSFRNEIMGQTKGLPVGFYWGVYLGDERNGAWKIDIWAVDTAECKRLITYCTVIKQKLTPTLSHHIRDIKSQCWKDPGYRRDYISTDIYQAVLENNITGIEEFKHYLKTLKATKEA